MRQAVFSMVHEYDADSIPDGVKYWPGTRKSLFQ